MTISSVEMHFFVGDLFWRLRRFHHEGLVIVRSLGVGACKFSVVNSNDRYADGSFRGW